MSQNYTFDENADIWSRYEKVMETADAEEALTLAYLFEAKLDFETADDLRRLAKQWNQDDWAHDELIGN